MKTSKPRTVRVLATATALIGGILTVGAAEPDSHRPTDSHSPKVSIKTPAGITLSGPDAYRFHLQELKKISPDIYKTVWTDGDATVRVTSRAQSKVRVEKSRGSLSVESIEATDTAGMSGKQLIARQENRGMSAVDQQIAMGMDPVQARKTFAPEPRAAAEKGPIIATWCVDLSAEGGKLESHGCNLRRLDQDDPHGRYIADEMKTSAVSHDDDFWFPYKLNRVDSILIYRGGEEVVSWQPLADQPVAQCGSITVSVEGKGGGASVSSPICPDTFGPSDIPSAGDPRFGAAWSGPMAPIGHFRGTHGVTLVKQAAGAEGTGLQNKIRYSWGL
ncbi:hypothetical protein J7I98_12640 [Streptomyces sp. ISL-98]|uniref:hypothetical protein n=1 Tax=Streptomyces sp. ISL-98 TaxID=2819192 RepID=UPI001BE7757A|nr:hypothetical protein [Streptomyces sp. ISL-98]MBT2506724.1 hypothetical protein [Streptomyces sp. ISL-98]